MLQGGTRIEPTTIKLAVVGIVIIFLAITPFVWGRLLHPLERFGWVSGTILVSVELLSWVVGTIDFQYRLGIGIAALVILGVTAVWSRVHKAETEQGTSNAEKLRAFSPIHMMIMAIEKASPREASFGPYTGDGIGRIVGLDDVPNLDKVRSVFSEHASILGDHHLNEWLKFEKNIRESQVPRGFWVGRSEWKWFNELEREYQETLNAGLLQTAPEIEVKISPPKLCEPRQLAYLLQEEVPPHQIYLCQSLTIKATTTKVNSLSAKTWIDGREPYYCLNWAPKESDPESENRKRVDLFREEDAQLPIWYATKQLAGPEKGYPIWLTVVSDDVFRSVELDRLEKPTIDIAIQFIGDNYTDPKPRHFKLIAKPNAETWDELCLTEEH